MHTCTHIYTYIYRFVGSVDALKPPAPDTANKVLPMGGIKCDGSAFMQFGNRMGGGGKASGFQQVFDFTMDQALKMQQCRAARRNTKYKFLRPDFMNQYACYTPVMPLSVFTKPPAGEEFNIFTAKMLNAWSGVEISMKTLMNEVVAKDWELASYGYYGSENEFFVNFDHIDSCTAKSYTKQGCMLSADIKTVLGVSEPSEFIIGVKQCFSTSPSVPIPAMGHAIKAQILKSRGTVILCSKHIRALTLENFGADPSPTHRRPRHTQGGSRSHDAGAF